MEFKDIVHGKKYTTKQGEEKTKWSNIGTLTIFDDGGISVTLDLIPLNWDGRAKVFDKKPMHDNQTQMYGGMPVAQQQVPQQQNTQYKQPMSQQVPDVQSDSVGQDYIPF